MDANEFWPALVAHREKCWEELRSKGRVVFANGVYHLTHRDDVVAALAKPADFSSAQMSQKSIRGFSLIPTAVDPPQHGRYRKILLPSLTVKEVQELTPTMIRVARGLIGALVARGGCDVVKEVVTPYADMCLQSSCGLPLRDAANVAHWRDAMLNHPAGSPPYRAASDLLFSYLEKSIEQHRTNPGLGGVLGQIAAAGLPAGEALSVAFSAVGGAGNNEAVIASFALSALASNPVLRQRLCADPAQTGALVDEVMRLEPPVPNLLRVTTRAVTVGTVTIPARSMVWLQIGAINREDTDDHSSSKRHQHWTFGGGPHRCPAANLARTELTVLINEWLRRIPEFEIQPGFRPPVPDIVFSRGTNRLPSLPLRWAAG